MQSKYLQKKFYYKSGIDESEYSKEVYERKEKLDLYAKLTQNNCPQKLALEAIKISRATYYRWKKRYNGVGLAGLKNGSCRPNKTRKSECSERIKSLILKTRKCYPLWGKYKIAVILQREHHIKISASTVGRVLSCLVKRNVIFPVRFFYGHVKIKRKRIFNRHAKRWQYGMKSQKPGELIQVDHAVIQLTDSFWVRHFTAICPVTKLLVEQAYLQATSANAANFLEQMVASFPFPIESIQVDGGSEFMDQFENGCQKNNIKLYVLPPKSPEYNGNVERTNSTAKYEFYYLYDGKLSIKAIRKELNKFTIFYNSYRPHQALQYLTPLQYYQNREAP